MKTFGIRSKNYSKKELDKMELELFMKRTSKKRLKKVKKVLSKERGWEYE